MLRVVIVDDEISGVTALEISLKEFCKDVEIVGVANSALEGMKIIYSQNPDLVFCDIEMPGMSGIEMIESFTDRKFEVVFVTAYNQYAIKAIKLSAIDYILKPINIPDLINVVEKLKKEIKSDPEKDDKIRNLKAALSGKISIPSQEGPEYIKIQDIVRVEADGSYTLIFTIDGKSRMVTRNLKSIQDSLDIGNFYRTHKSHIINLEHIVKYSPLKDGGIIKMIDGSEIPVSRNVKSDLSEILNKFTK
jgi:two-component system, LytTR family, response regulator